MDQVLSTALKLEAVQAAAVGREKQTESHRSDKGRDRYARNVVVTGSHDDNVDVSLLSKVDKVRPDAVTVQSVP